VTTSPGRDTAASRMAAPYTFQVLADTAGTKLPSAATGLPPESNNAKATRNTPVDRKNMRGDCSDRASSPLQGRLGHLDATSSSLRRVAGRIRTPDGIIEVFTGVENRDTNAQSPDPHRRE